MKPIRECTFYFRNKIFHKYATNLKKLGVEATYLLNIPPLVKTWPSVALSL
jgi:hypothetical protein